MQVKRKVCKNKIKFKDLKIGDVFENPCTNRIFIKIEQFETKCLKMPKNAVSVEDGLCIGFEDDELVNEFNGIIVEE